MGTPQNHLMVIAGEASGDMRGAGLIKALRQLRPELSFSGIGGSHLRNCGMEIIEDITSLAVIGFSDVFKNLPRIRRVFYHILDEIKRRKPLAVILVDYPGFNLRLAKEIKKSGIKVIFYISPQVWAWREGRIRSIKKIVDRMLVLFDFEPGIYAKYGMKVDFVGHPLVDEVIISEPPTSIKASLGLKPNDIIVGLMPGSREKEIVRHLPTMLDTARLLSHNHPQRKFLILKADTVDAKLLNSIIDASGVPAIIYSGPTYNGIGMMDAAIVASGTATLETALLLKPMIIMYKTSPLTYFLAKKVVRIPYIGLVNVVAGKNIVEEFIQDEANAPAMAKAVENILSNPNDYAAMTNTLAQTRTKLGLPGASKRAAKVILEAISISKTA